MARGQKIKQEIANKILETFEGSFLYNDGKEIRINGTEDGELVQVKVTLTAAKESVSIGEDNAIPGQASSNNEINFNNEQKETKVAEPTEEEKQNVSDLLKALGL